MQHNYTLSKVNQGESLLIVVTIICGAKARDHTNILFISLRFAKLVSLHVNSLRFQQKIVALYDCNDSFFFMTTL